MIGPFVVDASGLLAAALRIVVVLVVAVVAYQLVRLALVRLVRTVSEGALRRPFGAVAPERLGKRMGTVEALGIWVARVFISLVALLTILYDLGINVGPAIAGLGLAGLAISLGAQNLVKDYLNGMLIVFEQQFDVGDLVRAAGVSGTVEEFSLRRTRLRDADGVVHDVPNSAIAVVSNLSGSTVRLQVEVQVAAAEVVAAASRIDELGRAWLAEPGWAGRLVEAPQVTRLADPVADRVTLTVRGRVRAADAAEATSELRHRLLAAFPEETVRLA